MNHVKGVGHRKPTAQNCTKMSLNLSVLKAMQSLAHDWWNHTRFRILKVKFHAYIWIFKRRLEMRTVTRENLVTIQNN